MRHGARINFTSHLDALSRAVARRQDAIEAAQRPTADAQRQRENWQQDCDEYREHLNDRYELAPGRTKG